MNTTPNPRDAAAAVNAHPVLPAGDDERFVGFGVMGLPFATGHYLALRQFPATPSPRPTSRCGTATRPAPGPFTPPPPVRRAAPATSARPRPTMPSSATSTSRGSRPGRCTSTSRGFCTGRSTGRRPPATRMMTAIGVRLPESAWTNPTMLGPDRPDRRAGVRHGEMRLTGTAANGQRYMVAPRNIWACHRVTGDAGGRDLGPSARWLRQARLGDFRLAATGHRASSAPVISRLSIPAGIGRRYDRAIRLTGVSRAGRIC